MAVTGAKLEFAVQMSCPKCVDKIEEALSGQEGVKLVSVDFNEGQVVVEASRPSYQVKDLIETTGCLAVLQGSGTTEVDRPTLGAAVAMMSGNGVIGVTRLLQLNENTCVVEGTVDGLSPGPHSLCVHELGDLSQGCLSCGDVFELNADHSEKKYGDLGIVTANSQGRAAFRLESPTLKVWDVIGRSLIVHDAASYLEDRRLASGIVARSAGLFENSKRICACDGVSVWEERNTPLAGPGRQQRSPIAQL